MVILMILYQATYSGAGTMVNTMFAKTFGLTEDFNVIITGVSALYGSFFFNDLYYLLNVMMAFINGFDPKMISIVGLLIQSVYAVGMIIFPTSILLIAGLSYFEVSYKQWIKYIWKFALIIFLLVLLVCAILTAI